MNKRMTILHEGEGLPVSLSETFLKNDKYVKDKKLTCLGYFRKDKEMVFILPKSFSSITEDTLKGDNLNLSLWLYGSIDQYRKRVKTGIVNEEEGSVIETSKTDEGDSTLLDHIISLRNFYKRNKDLILMVYKETHRGYNRVNWAKTVRRCVPIIKNNQGQVAYINVFNERRHIHDQEKLMVLYFSTMRYITNKYGIDMPHTEYYTLLGENEFEVMVDSDVICSQLKSIRQQYFNDRLQELWHLLYAFHEKISNAESETQQQEGNHQDEYLIATNFDRVFEDMIDYLIGDPSLAKLKKYPGRIIDHIFTGKAIFDDDVTVYYIGDSKYYDPDKEIEKASIAKQYDYARHIIQLTRDKVTGRTTDDNKDALDVIDDEIANYYYNEETHSYAITPNFFIRPKRPKKEDVLNADNLEFESIKDESTKDIKSESIYHHKDRLFDCSTQFLLYYNIGLPFILKSYATDDISMAKEARKKVKEEVWNDLQEVIKKQYIIKEKNDVIELDGNSSFSCKYIIFNKYWGQLFKKKNGYIFAEPKK